MNRQAFANLGLLLGRLKENITAGSNAKAPIANAIKKSFLLVLVWEAG